MKIAGLALAMTLLVAVSGAAEQKRTAGREIIIKEKKLEDVKKQIREEKKGIKSISEKETGILAELQEINKNLTAKREELKRSEASLERIRGEAAYKNGRINRLEKEKKDLSGRLKSRLRAMYKMRRGELLKVMFSADSTDLGRRQKYLSMIMDSDSNLIKNYEGTLVSLEGEKARLDALYREMDSERRDAALKKGEAEAFLRQRIALLTEVKREKDRKLKTVKELEQAAVELSALLDKLRASQDETQVVDGGFSGMKGKLSMPVEGNVVSFYGKVKHPRFQTVTFNNGIVISAPIGAPIKSIYDGKIIYVGWLKGYGQVMIVDNGGGFYTLFAHLSKVLRQRGDTVKKGEEVGLVGDSGPEATPGLYFEIRQRGVPRDPMAWFAER